MSRTGPKSEVNFQAGAAPQLFASGDKISGICMVGVTRAAISVT